MDTSEPSPPASHPPPACTNASQYTIPFQFNPNPTRNVAQGHAPLDFFHESVPPPPPLPKSGTLTRRAKTGAGTPANIAPQSFFQTQTMAMGVFFPTNTNHNRIGARPSAGSPVNGSAVQSPQSPDSPAVNDTSINPAEVREQVSRMLVNRPPREHLVDRHLMAPENIPNQHFQTVEKLERQHRSDSLNHMLRARPTRDTLLQRGIMHDNEKRQFVTQTLQEKLEKRPGPMDVMEKGYFYPYGTAKQPKKFVFHKMIWENGQMKKTTDPKTIGGPTRRQRSRPSSRNSSRTSLVDHFKDQNDEHARKLIKQQERYLQIEEAASKLPIPTYADYIETSTRKMTLSERGEEPLEGRSPSPVSSVTGGLRTIGEKSQIPDPPGPPPKLTAKTRRVPGQGPRQSRRRGSTASRRESACAPLEFTQECLIRETYEDLKNQCKWAGLTQTGRKQDLINRLIDFHKHQDQEKRELEEKNQALQRENLELKKRLETSKPPVIHKKMNSEPNSPRNRSVQLSGSTTPVLESHMPSNGNFLTPQYTYVSPQGGGPSVRNTMAESIPSVDSGVDDSRPQPVSLGSSQTSIPTTASHFVNPAVPYPIAFANFPVGSTGINSQVGQPGLMRSFEYPLVQIPSRGTHRNRRSRPSTPVLQSRDQPSNEMDTTSSPPSGFIHSNNTLEACLGMPVSPSPLLQCPSGMPQPHQFPPNDGGLFFDPHHSPGNGMFSNGTSMYPQHGMSSRSSSRASLNQIPGSMYSSANLLDQGSSAQLHPSTRTPQYGTLSSHPIYQHMQQSIDEEHTGAHRYGLVMPGMHSRQLSGQEYWQTGRTPTNEHPEQVIGEDRHRHPPHHYMPNHSAPPLPYAPPEVFAMREARQASGGSSTEANFSYANPDKTVQQNISTSISIPQPGHSQHPTFAASSSFIQQNQQLSTSASTITNVPAQRELRSQTPERQQPLSSQEHAPPITLSSMENNSPPHDMNSVADIVRVIEQNFPMSSNDNISQDS